jgi:WS/DGAT/MGAT family acyltransferase
MAVVNSPVWAEMLPRDRPLWDMAVINGLEGDRSAILSRVHHCMVDGVSGIELLLAVLDLTPNPEPTPPPAEEWKPQPLPNPAQSWNDAVTEGWAAGLRAFSEAQRNLLDARAQFRGMTDFSRAMQVTLPTAFRRPAQTNWNRRISRARRAAWTEMSFQEIRGIRSRLGGTVNDVVLTILGGALGRYLQEHGFETKDTRVRFMIPVNVRQESEKGALGNRVSMMLPEIPVGITSAADRLQAVRDEMERLKSSEQAGAFDAMRRFADNVPAAFHALAGLGGVPPGGANLVCTNVPGPLIPLFAVGHRMLAHYPLVPLAGDLGIGVGVTSYNKGLYLGVMSDPTLIDDVERIRDLIDDEFRVLRYMADVPVSDLPDFGVAPSANGSARKSPASSTPASSPGSAGAQPAAATPVEGGA